jgi:hypothetical protein
MSDPSPRPPLSQDAAIVLALAETAIPFAGTREDEAERWVRLLRLHGQVGGALQGLGVGEAPLETMARAPFPNPGTRRRADGNVVATVAQSARRFAAGRNASMVATVDVLFGVFETYGKTFDRALYVRGATREELIERLALDAPAPARPKLG